MQKTNGNFSDETLVSENLMKALALMQNQDQSYFFVGNVAYKGDEDEAKEAFESLDITTPATWEEYVSDNYTEVAEYEEYEWNYMICTDSEADDKWDEQLENYIDECLEIPKSIERYFDREAWKTDARMDGRGHTLSSYDGNEDEETVILPEGLHTDGDTTFYIYRTN